MQTQKQKQKASYDMAIVTVMRRPLAEETHLSVIRQQYRDPAVPRSPDIVVSAGELEITRTFRSERKAN